MRLQPGSRFAQAIEAMFPDHDKDERQRMYREYSLTTNERAFRIYEVISHMVNVQGKKVLDIGCAYGGVPIVFAQAGADAVGIDISERLLDLARVNAEDHDVNVIFRRMDIMDSETVGSLGGAFDIIVCNDVIEHVQDPACCIDHIAYLLKPGGYVYMEIPNKFSFKQILSDGHFCLFGITALPRHLAKKYYAHALHRPPENYDVGYWKHLHFYVNRFRKQGVEMKMLNPIPHDIRTNATVITELIKATNELHSKAGHFDSPGLDLSVICKTRSAVSRLTKIFSELVNAYVETGNHTYFEKIYTFLYLDYWKLLGRHI